MSALSERAAFARLVKAVEPYLDALVFVGGWAHRLFAVHAFANPVNFEPLATDDADVAAPLRLEVRKETLAQRLKAAGFTVSLPIDRTQTRPASWWPRGSLWGTSRGSTHRSSPDCWIREPG